MLIHDPKTGQKLISIIKACTYAVSNAIWSCTENKPKGLKVAKEELRLIGSMVDRLDGR